MRLMHTETLAFHEFLGDQFPPYAILSHTWEREELSYQDLLNPTDAVRAKLGYAKLLAFARKSRELGYSYAWIDTCCIDKCSSAELTEAINSMYAWYKHSGVCLVYLSDYSSTAADNIRKPRWFTRGWTLQELVAPRSLLFFSSTWEEVQFDLSTLHELTSISAYVLQTGIMDDISVAQKMSWASQRETTRVEDMAYCLMGLFGVNMPLLYGEGANAFIRLQEEIVRRSDDETIFLWKDKSAHPDSYRGIFARHPSEFAQCRYMGRARGLSTYPSPYNLTNTGLHMSLRLIPLEKTPLSLNTRMNGLLRPQDNARNELFVPILHCGLRGEPDITLSVLLKKVRKNGQHYARVRPDIVLELDLVQTTRKLKGFRYVPKRQPTLPFKKLPSIEHVCLYQEIPVNEMYRMQQVMGFLVEFGPSILLSRDEDCHGMSSWRGEVLQPISNLPFGIFRIEYDTGMSEKKYEDISTANEVSRRETKFLLLGIEHSVALERISGVVWYRGFDECPTQDEIRYLQRSEQKWLYSWLNRSSLILHDGCLLARATISVEDLVRFFSNKYSTCLTA